MFNNISEKQQAGLGFVISLVVAGICALAIFLAPPVATFVIGFFALFGLSLAGTGAAALAGGITAFVLAGTFSALGFFSFNQGYHRKEYHEGFFDKLLIATENDIVEKKMTKFNNGKQRVSIFETPYYKLGEEAAANVLKAAGFEEKTGPDSNQNFVDLKIEEEEFNQKNNSAEPK